MGLSLESNIALIALGANLPVDGHPPEVTLRQALAELTRSGAAAGLALREVSRFYRTPCFPEGAGPDYVNAAAALSLPPGMDAEALLQALHAVEATFGRVRHHRWAGRTLDLDLLAIGDSICPDEMTLRHWRELPPEDQRSRAPDRLILPHPRLQDRAFVLVPLCDVAPDWRDPLTGQTAADMLQALPAAERDAVKPL